MHDPPVVVEDPTPSTLSRFFPRDRPAERIGRCLTGLVLFGIGISMILAADLGAAPWDAFHTGVAERLHVSTGTVIIVVGLLLLALWIPLRERPGLGTLLNAIVIGLVVDVAVPLIIDTDRLAIRIPLMLAGVAIVAIGSGVYIGAGLAPGPRDGLMTGLARQSIGGRPISIQVARTSVELIVLAAGIALGGSVGIGTAVFTFGIGPLVQLVLPRVTMGTAPVPPVTGTFGPVAASRSSPE